MANIFQRAREWAAPTLKSSAFLERGVLTPEEFVKAGDELVFKCPTWQWGSGDKKHAKSYLPADKQVCALMDAKLYFHLYYCFLQ